MPRISRLAALAVVSLACSDSASEPVFEDCPGGTVTVQASTGLSPTFSWSPSCGVAFLEVYPAAGGGALWTVYGSAEPGENPIASGVRYGTAPRDGNVIHGPEPLQAGTVYRVRLARQLCDQGELCILRDAGTVDFTP